MSIIEAKQKIEELIKMDSTILDFESLNTSKVLGDLYNYYMEYSRVMFKLKKERLKLYKEKWKMYSGKQTSEYYKEHPFNLSLAKSEIDIFINSDESILELDEKLHELNIFVGYIEDCLKSVNNRSFAIKNAIEFRQLILNQS